MATRLDLSNLSLKDALDLAKLIELEAYHRYKLFASQLGIYGGYDAGSFFASMADNEAKHGQEIAARREALFGDKPARVSLDDLYDVEAPDVGAVYSGMSLMKAFEVGLAAEQKAYDFYTRALPQVTNAEVKALFTELRDEEVEHVEMLKAGMAKLPPEASYEMEEDLDDEPYL